MDALCSVFADWLGSAASASSDPLPAGLVDHVAGCSRCRGQLLVLVADLSGPWAPILDQPCHTIEEQLAAFVDDERDNGLVTAARNAPAVWWHTLVCLGCDELYRALLALAAAPIKPWLSAAARPARIRIDLPRGLIARSAAVATALGAAWGDLPSDMLIKQEQYDRGLLLLYLRRKVGNRLTLVVETEPQDQGIVTIDVAFASFYQELDERGSAVFVDLDASLFDGNADVTIWLDPLRSRAIFSAD